MRILTAILAITGVLLLQTMLVDRFFPLRFVDLFLLLNIYYALNFGPLPCLVLSVSSGFVQDTFSSGILGMNAFSKTVVAYLLSVASSRLMIKHPFVIMLLIMLATLTDLFIVRGLYQLFGLKQPLLTMKDVLASCVLNMLVGMISFQSVDRFRLKKEYV